jgi:hypothetical protein
MEDLRFLDFEISALAGLEDLVNAELVRLRERTITERRQEHGEELEYLGMDIHRSLDYARTRSIEGCLKFRVKQPDDTDVPDDRFDLWGYECNETA